MRAVFIGASSLAATTAGALVKRKHEVVIVEQNRERINTLSEELDCGFLHGDGSSPTVLREADPGQTDILFCLTNNDQTNIIASLVGRSLGFARVVTKIDAPEFEHVCIELGLEDTIIPARAIGRYLTDMFEGLDRMDFSSMIKDEARVFSFVVHEANVGSVEQLNLPKGSAIVCFYRNGKFVLAEKKSSLNLGDEVLLITHSENIQQLHERFNVQSR